MGIGKEAVELGIKGVQKLTPEIQKYIKGFLGETKQKLVSDMAQNGHPKYQTIYQNLDTLSKSTDENVKETLGLNVHKDLDGILADGQQLQTSRNAQQAAQNTSGKLGRSEAHRAHKGKGDKGPLSLIAGTPNTIIKKEPHNTNKAMEWARGAYAYAQQGKSGNKAQPLRGYPRYVAEDGTLFKPRPNVGRKGGYQLKFQSMDLLKGYDELRKLREAPWRKQEVIDQLQAILEKQGKGDKLDKLLKIMLKDYNTKLKGIKAAKQTKGHFISLDKGGLDIAENFGPQKGKSTKNPKTGEWEMGNYAEQADSSIPEGTNVPTTWEEYVALKLPLLK